MKPWFSMTALALALTALGVAQAEVRATWSAQEELKVPPPPADMEPNGVILAQDVVPLERVLRAIAKRYPGHQLSVSGPSEAGGVQVYRIKWLTDAGAVLYIIANAENGSIMSVDGG